MRDGLCNTVTGHLNFRVDRKQPIAILIYDMGLKAVMS